MLTQITLPSSRVNCYLFQCPKLTPSTLKELKTASQSVQVITGEFQTKQNQKNAIVLCVLSLLLLFNTQSWKENHVNFPRFNGGPKSYVNI